MKLVGTHVDNRPHGRSQRAVLTSTRYPAPLAYGRRGAGLLKIDDGLIEQPTRPLRTLQAPVATGIRGQSGRGSTPIVVAVPEPRRSADGQDAMRGSRVVSRSHDRARRRTGRAGALSAICAEIRQSGMGQFRLPTVTAKT